MSAFREYDQHDTPATTKCIECTYPVLRDETVKCLGCGERICKPCEEKSALCGQCRAEMKKVTPCIECDAPTVGRLCARCFVQVKL